MLNYKCEKQIKFSVSFRLQDIKRRIHDDNVREIVKVSFEKQRNVVYIYNQSIAVQRTAREPVNSVEVNSV